MPDRMSAACAQLPVWIHVHPRTTIRFLHGQGQIWAICYSPSERSQKWCCLHPPHGMCSGIARALP